MENTALTPFESQIATDITMLNEQVAVAKKVETVANDADARAADLAIKQVNAAVKVIHDQRMTLTRKIDLFKKQVMAKETEICAEANKELERLRGLVGAYLLAQQSAQQEEAARAVEIAEAEAAFGGDAQVPAPVVPSKPVAGVKSREYWGWKIVDAAKVPRQYCTPDPKLINEYRDAVKRNGGSFESLAIPGVEFTKEFRV